MSIAATAARRTRDPTYIVVLRNGGLNVCLKFSMMWKNVPGVELKPSYDRRAGNNFAATREVTKASWNIRVSRIRKRKRTGQKMSFGNSPMSFADIPRAGEETGTNKRMPFANSSWNRSHAETHWEHQVAPKWTRNVLNLRSPRMTVRYGTDCIYSHHARSFILPRKIATRFHQRSTAGNKPTVGKRRRGNTKGFVLRQTFRNFSVFVRLHLTEIWFCQELVDTLQPRKAARGERKRERERENNTSATKSVAGG